MTNEEIQRVMEFIIKQQESLFEAMTQSEARISKLEMAAVGLYASMIEIGKAQKALTDKVGELADKVTELAEAQLHTEPAAQRGDRHNRAQPERAFATVGRAAAAPGLSSK